MKQPTPDRWQAYMRECAERCRRQLAAERIRARPRITSYDVWRDAPYIGGTLTYGQSLPAPAMTATEVRLRTEGRSLPGHERAADWFESTIRKGCTDD